MNLSRQTRDQLWRSLLTQSAAPRDRHSVSWAAIVPITALLTLLALYLLTKI